MGKCARAKTPSASEQEDKIMMAETTTKRPIKG